MKSARQTGRGRAEGADPLRTCVVTRTRLAPDRLLRFVLSPAGEVVPDLAQTLPGRGAWVCTNREALASAVRKHAFDRAFKRSVTVPSDLVERVEQLLFRRALEALSLANKAGCVVTGYSNVDQRIEDAAGVVLVQAADASEDGRRRLARKYQAICDALGAQPLIIDLFSVEQISLATGRLNVVHAAVDRARVTDGFIRASERLQEFCTEDSTVTPVAGDGGESPSEQANDVGRETEQV